MKEISYFSSRQKVALALVLMGLPAVVFYIILWKNAVRIPFLDDYDIILSFVNAISHCKDLSCKLLYAVTVQHNGYKLMFDNAVILGQYAVFGQVHFLSLVAFGDSFALLIFLVVCAMSSVAWADQATKAILLVPVAYLWFQLQYASALDFASCSLQQLTVIFFSLLSIYLIGKENRWSFAGGCISLVFAIASSPNGFFVAPVGFLVMLQAKHWRRIAVWTVDTGLMLALYLFRYNHTSSQAMPQGAGGSMAHFNIVYALSFLGSSAARYESLAPSLALGLVLCGIFAFAVKRRYFNQNPAVFYSMLFIIVNALAISGLRSDLGLAQSLASRYRTYSNLFLVFSYVFLIENTFPLMKSKSIRRSVLIVAGMLSVAFCVLSDVAGGRFLHAKKVALTKNYNVEWKKNLSARENFEGIGNPALLHQMDAGVFEINLPVMQESVRLGVYQPPQDQP